MQTAWLWSVARYLHLGTDRRAGVIDGKPFCPRFEDFLRTAVGQAVSDPLTAADALDRLSAAGVCGSVFCVVVASFDRATMSRKFCLLNQTNSISWALMPDRRNQPHSLLVRPRHIASVRRACYRRVKSVRPRVPDGRPSGKFFTWSTLQLLWTVSGYTVGYCLLSCRKNRHEQRLHLVCAFPDHFQRNIKDDHEADVGNPAVPVQKPCNKARGKAHQRD